jgi:putative (di)nucleoside polyphosphate hydrolase
VAAIVRNAKGKILLCERNDVAGAWQFPQGGVQPGESIIAALRRELREEISLRPSDYEVREKRGPYRYLFPSGMMKKGAHGQEQTYFLLDLKVPDSAVDVETPAPEFSDIQWVVPTDFNFSWVPPMKLNVYRAVLHDFFGVH